jgi:hypothetical protein
MASSSSVVPTGAEEEAMVDLSRGAWEGSDVTSTDIEWLRLSRRIPLEVECRLPAEELAPITRPGEFVVFVAHFERGFGLPASTFTRNLMNRFGLQPHHLPANAIMIISAFATFCEAYLGLWPSINLWAKYFQFRQQVIPDRDTPAGQKLLTQCGATTVLPRKGSIFPRVQGLESCKKWLRTFFYVKNSSDVDRINLPKFVVGPPTKLNWNYDPRDLDREVNLIHKVVHQLRKDGLTGDDLLATFLGRRVSPL